MKQAWCRATGFDETLAELVAPYLRKAVQANISRLGGTGKRSLPVFFLQWVRITRKLLGYT